MRIALIPLLRVNYSIWQIFKSLFISEKKDTYRSELISVIQGIFNVKDVKLTSSCRTAIYKLLVSLPQSKVIVPAYTCGVVVEAAVLANKEIIYVDVNINTFNVDTYKMADKDSIVIATHQYGKTCDIKKLVSHCHAVGAIVIEDCAGSLGSSVNNCLSGTFGDYSVFSFSASKTFQVPTKGGFIIANRNNNLNSVSSNNPQSAISFKLKHSIKGMGFCLRNTKIFCGLFNYIEKFREEKNVASGELEDTYIQEFYEWQAFIALKQFNQWNMIMAKHQEIDRQYHENLHNSKIKFQSFDENSIRIRIPILVEDKDRLVNDALLKGIELGSGYDKVYNPTHMPVAEYIENHIVYLPISSKHSRKEIKRVIDFINSWS